MPLIPPQNASHDHLAPYQRIATLYFGVPRSARQNDPFHTQPMNIHLRIASRQHPYLQPLPSPPFKPSSQHITTHTFARPPQGASVRVFMSGLVLVEFLYLVALGGDLG